MNDDRDDDGDDYRTGFPFFGGFRGFFGDMDKQFQDMDKHFQDMSRHIEEMSKQMGDGFKDFGEISTGFHPPSMGGSVPPLQQDPRDQMLKGNDEGSPSVAQSQPSDGRLFVWSPTNTRTITGDGFDFTVAGTNSSRVTQVVRHADGSIERTEKTTRDGQTCTTVTLTDPNGVSTTKTTCDRPAIEGTPRLTSPDSPPTFKTTPPMVGKNPPGVNTDLTKEDAGFFSRLFGNFGFKPKS